MSTITAFQDEAPCGVTDIHLHFGRTVASVFMEYKTLCSFPIIFAEF